MGPRRFYNESFSSPKAWILEPGDYTLDVALPGCRPVTRPLRVGTESPQGVTVRLKGEPK